MRLTCYTLESHPVLIRPAEPRREWMDETPKAFAYRCLPLTMANSHGWEILSPVAFEAIWNGGEKESDLEVKVLAGDAGAVASHFGGGLLTFVPNLVLRTPAGANLWISGPANRFKDGAQALSALVETDWMPYSFTMSWKLTRPHHPVRFELGEPYCFFFPVQRGLVDACEPGFRPIETDPELTESFECAYGRRLKVHRAAGCPAAVRNELRQEANWYMKGSSPDGSSGFADHQTRLRARPFADWGGE